MLKKVLSLLAVCSMLFGLCAITTFADDDPLPSFSLGDDPATLRSADGRDDGTGVVEIEKTLKLLNAGTKHPAETFYLVQTDKESAHSSLTSTTMPDLVLVTDDGYSGTDRLVGKISYIEGEINKTDASATELMKKIAIGLPEFGAVGIYTYTLEEVDNKTAGIQYWNNPIKLIITVVENDDGKFYIQGIHCEETFDPLNANGTKTDNFENIYKANSVDPATGGVRIEKEVTGNLGDRDKYFDFTITFTKEAGMNYSTAPLVTVNGGSHTSNPTSLDFADATNWAADGTWEVTFKLKHNETIAFGNVPYGVKYAYEEADYTSEEYVTTYPQKDSGAVDPETGDPVMVDNKSDIIVNEASISYTVTNDKNQPIDTGVIVDSLPYVMVLAMVMLGGVMFLVSKKRRIAEDRA